MNSTIAQNTGFWMLSFVILFGLSSLVSCGVKNLDDMDQFLSGPGPPNNEEEAHDSEYPTQEQPTYDTVKEWG